MTTALAFEKAKTIWIAMDNGVTCENMKFPAARKNWLIEHQNYMVAVSGRTCDLHWVEEIVMADTAGKDKKESYFPNRIREFEEKLREKILGDENKGEDFDIEILVTTPYHIYFADHTLIFDEVEKYMAIGPGKKFALGAMSALYGRFGDTPQQAEDYLKDIYKSVVEFDSLTHPEFTARMFTPDEKNSGYVDVNTKKKKKK